MQNQSKFIDPGLARVGSCVGAMASDHRPTNEIISESALRCIVGWGRGIQQIPTDLGESAVWLAKSVKYLLYDRAVAATTDNIEIIASTKDIPSFFKNLMQIQKKSIQSPIKLSQEIKVGFNKFAEDFSRYIDEDYREFMCLPNEVRAELICNMTLRFFLGGKALTSIAAAGVWTKESSLALKEFIQALKKQKAHSGLSYSESLKQAALVLNESIKETQLLQRWPQSQLVKTTDQAGAQKYVYEKKNKTEGRELWSKYPVPVDSLTKTINANDEVGKAILVDAVANSSGKGMLFIDVNDLGKVNKFAKGQLSGDVYIKEIGDSIRSAIRSSDLTFRTGGDELVLLINTNDKAAIRQVAEKISSSINQNPKLKELFREQSIYYKEQYQSIQNAKSLEQIPERFRSKMTAEELNKAKDNFTSFQSDKINSMKDIISSHAGTRPSVSVGSIIIRQQETYEAALERSSKIADQAKLNYKAEQGQNLSKYGGSVSKSRIKPGTKPQIYDPQD